jgi:hypothetical protein
MLEGGGHPPSSRTTARNPGGAFPAPGAGGSGLLAEGLGLAVMLLAWELGVYVSHSPADFPLAEKWLVQAVWPLVLEFGRVEMGAEPPIA